MEENAQNLNLNGGSSNNTNDMIVLNSTGESNSSILFDTGGTDYRIKQVTTSGELGSSSSFKIESTEEIFGTSTVKDLMTMTPSVTTFNNKQVINSSSNQLGLRNSSNLKGVNLNIDSNFTGIHNVGFQDKSGVVAYIEDVTSAKDLLNLNPTSEPLSPTAGTVYYDSSTDKLRCYNGVTWKDLF